MANLGPGQDAFRVSSGLKRLLGRDLITSEFVAIFELVKNSYDAHATRVDLHFAQDRLVVLDNGKGMTARDIREKWLFVAFSAKRDGTEDQDYRDKISTRGAYAGSKGVGRFSCDRLGAGLRLQTRSREDGQVSLVELSWDAFEEDSHREFNQVPVALTVAPEFIVPATLTAPESGTMLDIIALREPWTREKLLELKAALTKLINPFAGVAGDFEIHIDAPSERMADMKELASSPDPQGAQRKVVNGRIENFIFETLRYKTTHISLGVSADGASLVSELTDRGALVYRVEEPNPYPRLAGSGLACNLFYLNSSAKKTFARRMGVPSVQFGSVFLFRHGFRIFPIGDEHDDTFGIDRRKQQGYARFLGTRDIIGRIDIAGSDDDFRESTSRDMGLIDTAAYADLKACFADYCFKRLERYVVGVTWEDPADRELEDASGLSSEGMRARISALVEKLAGTSGVKLLDYNRDLVRLVDEKSNAFDGSLKALRRHAEATGDDSLQSEVRGAEQKIRKVQQAEAAARAREDEERRARTAAEQAARAAAERMEQERKRSLFLESITTLDKQIIEDLHHQIIIHATNAQDLIAAKISTWSSGPPPAPSDVVSVLGDLSMLNQRILTIAQFSTKANFRLQSGQIAADLGGYITQYVAQVTPVYLSTSIALHCVNTAPAFMVSFRPIEFSMVVDNLISNAKRARATKVAIDISQGQDGALKVRFEDDGVGLPKGIELDRLFEKGFTTTRGSGLGLFHVRRTVTAMGGTVTAEPRADRGSRFEIVIPQRGVR